MNNLYIGVIWPIYILTIDPNFQRDILGLSLSSRWKFRKRKKNSTFCVSHPKMVLGVVFQKASAAGISSFWVLIRHFMKGKTPQHMFLLFCSLIPSRLHWQIAPQNSKETWNLKITQLKKGKSSSQAPFLGSMFVSGGVSQKYPILGFQRFHKCFPDHIPQLVADSQHSSAISDLKEWWDDIQCPWPNWPTWHVCPLPQKDHVSILVPGLKPNQPNHNNAVPRATKGTLWGFLWWSFSWSGISLLPETKQMLAAC